MSKPDRELMPKTLALAAAVAAIGAAVGAPVEQAMAGIIMEGKRVAATPDARGALQVKIKRGATQFKMDRGAKPGGLGPSLRQGKDDGSSQGKGGGSGQGKQYLRAPTPGGAEPGLRQGPPLNGPGAPVPGLKQR
jgi:hypothetical protein